MHAFLLTISSLFFLVSLFAVDAHDFATHFFLFPQRKSNKKQLNTLMKFKMKLTGNENFDSLIIN